MLISDFEDTLVDLEYETRTIEELVKKSDEPVSEQEKIRIKSKKSF